ncbi:MAG: transglutaminase domain-containing protein [Pseudomonadota bacterium]
MGGAIVARAIALSATLAAAVLGTVSAQTQPGEPYVASIPFETNGVEIRSGEPLHLTLSLNRTEQVASRYAHSTVLVEDVRAGAIDLVVDGQDRFTSAPLPHHSEASFVIDFDEPELTRLDARAKALDPASDTPPAVTELARLVFEALPEKTYERGFDIASQAARAGAGDCTEHSVLLAALSRAQGLPSRVVFGALIVAEANAAYGHAWNEVFVHGEWQLVDATLLDTEEGATLFYVPLATFDNEGPGYTMGLFDSLGSLPSKISVRPAQR